MLGECAVHKPGANAKRPELRGLHAIRAAANRSCDYNTVEALERTLVLRTKIDDYVRPARRKTARILARMSEAEPARTAQLVAVSSFWMRLPNRHISAHNSSGPPKTAVLGGNEEWA